MNKVPGLFLRAEKNPRIVTREVNPRCQWVIDGEGVATQKLDGTCVLIDHEGEMWKRFTLRPGREVPPTFEACEYDEITKKSFGWVLCSREMLSEVYHWEAYDANQKQWSPGTYELVGPKVQGGIERGFKKHYLWSHEGAELELLDGGPERNYDKIALYLLEWDAEGIVWQHPDGRWAKIKGKDFGINRKEIQDEIRREATTGPPIQLATAQQVIDHGK